jgi:hypothetical protein
MTDLEIDKALALAIGWKRILPNCKTNRLQDCWVWTGHAWRIFSHLDWNVIGPIAERYNCFPFRIRSKEEDFGKWNVVSRENDIMAASPQRAIALAVIQGAKK